MKKNPLVILVNHPILPQTEGTPGMWDFPMLKLGQSPTGQVGLPRSWEALVVEKHMKLYPYIKLGSFLYDLEKI